MLSFWNPEIVKTETAPADRKSAIKKERGEVSTDKPGSSANEKSDPHFTRGANGSLIF